MVISVKKDKQMTHQETVSVACINFCAEWGDKKGNLSKIKTFSIQAAEQGNNIIIFPELALTGYECNERNGSNEKSCSMHKELAETIPGPSTEAICELACKLDVYIIFGMPEQDKKKPDILYISSVVL